VKFALVEAEKAPRRSMACRLLNVSRSGFYAWRGRPEPARVLSDRRLAVKVRESFERSRKTYGSPRIRADLAAHVTAQRM
jgi:hypothetical protein